MLSHSISLSNDQSELQFISDLISLCSRHKLTFGEPQDLAHLGADLIFNDAFRTDLFTLCTAISHFDEVPPTAEQLLLLVVRAFGGPSLTLVDISTGIPQDARSVFLTGYHAWSERETHLDPDLLKPDLLDPASPIPASSPRPSLYYDAASRIGSDLSEPREDQPIHHSAANEPSPKAALTSNELRMYLEEVERRMRQIELEQFAIRANASDEDSYPPDTSDGQSVHLAKEPAGIRITARVRHLQTLVAVLASLLLIVCASAAIFAYHFFRPQLPSLIASSAPTQTAAASPIPSSASVPTHDFPGTPNARLPQLSNPTTKSDSPSNNPAASVPKPVGQRPVLEQPVLPASQPAQPSDRLVAVPAATMMSYAVSTPDPIYPATRHFGVDSTVAVKTTISKDGDVTNAQALSGTPAVRAAALQAVQAWRFKPFMHDGNPVPVETTFKFFFGNQ